MLEILLVTHGGFARGILSTLGMIAGDVDAVEAMSVEEGDDPGQFVNELRAKVNELDEDPNIDGVLVLVDLLGGTPSNSVTQILRDADPSKLRCVTGLNFPMLVEAVFSRDTMSLPELEASCIEAAKNGVISLTELFGGTDS